MKPQNSVPVDAVCGLATEQRKRRDQENTDIADKRAVDAQPTADLTQQPKERLATPRKLDIVATWWRLAETWLVRWVGRRFYRWIRQRRALIVLCYAMFGCNTRARRRMFTWIRCVRTLLRLYAGYNLPQLQYRRER